MAAGRLRAAGMTHSRNTAKSGSRSAGRSVSGDAYYYTEGTAARVLEPAYEPVHKRKSQKAAKKQAKYMEAKRIACVSLNLPLTLLLVAAVAISVVVGYKYLCLKSSLDVHMNNIKTMESQLDTMRTENDALEKSIDTSVDLNEVYNIATTKLGMVRVDQNNIIQYDKTESEYVKQYEDIPSGQ